MPPNKVIKKTFNAGDFVFAKIRGYRAWPARILEAAHGRYNVYFYGTCNTSKLPRNQIFEYEKHRTRLGKVKQKVARNMKFREALQHIRQAHANPSKDFGYSETLAKLKGDFVENENVVLCEEVIETASNEVLETETDTESEESTENYIHVTAESD